MKTFKFRDIIYKYHLDMSVFPDELYSAIIDFLDLAVGPEVKKPRLKKLIETLDDNLSYRILIHIHDNKDNLESIICRNCRYREFYLLVFGVVAKGGFKANLIDKVNNLHFYNDASTDGIYQYYFLTKYKSKQPGAFGEWVFRVSHSDKVLEPIFLEKNNKEIIQSLDIYEEGGKGVDQESQVILNDLLEVLLDSLITKKASLQPHDEAVTDLLEKLKSISNV